MLALAAGVLGGNQACAAHEGSGSGEPPEIADLGDYGGRGQGVDAFESTEGQWWQLGGGLDLTVHLRQVEIGFVDPRGFEPLAS